MSGNRPRIVLYIDDSAASEEALKAFRDADVELSVVHTSGPNVPTAKLGNTVFAGRWGLDFLLYGLPKRVSDEVLT